MSRFFPVFLLLLLLGLGGYAVYSALPFISPRLTELKNQIMPSENKPTPSPDATVTPPTPTPTPVFTDSRIITEYLQTHVGIKGFAGDMYCSYLDIKTASEKPEKLYVLALCQEYYQKQTVTTPGTGIAVPVSLRLTWENDTFRIDAHATPESGSRYPDSLKSIFPPEVVEYLLSEKINQDLLTLQQKVDSAVYYPDEK